jgi:hypothetical protein
MMDLNPNFSGGIDEEILEIKSMCVRDYKQGFLNLADSIIK